MATDSNDNPEFPASIPLLNLRQVNAEYDPLELDKADDLYHGGKSFRKNIDRYLVRKEAEGSAGTMKAIKMAQFNPTSESAAGDFRNDLLAAEVGAGMNQYELRKKCAWYAPEISGVIDFMVAAIFQNPINILAVLDAPPSPIVAKIRSVIRQVLGRVDPDSPTAYWSNFNNDADGNGISFSGVLAELLRSAMKHKRAYLLVKFPELAGAQNRDQQKDDAVVQLLNARIVDDWQCDPLTGKLNWVRCHYQTKVRSQPFLQPDSTLDSWIYFTSKATYTYQIQYKDAEPPKDETPVDGVRVDHELGRLPVIPICGDHIHIMGRLAEICIALFNRQAAATWTLDSMAHAPMVIFSNRRQTQPLVLTERSGLQFDPADKVEYPSPSPTIFDVQQKDIERLENELFLCLQSMVLLASSRDTQGRASGIAKKRDFSALNTLLGAYAEPVLDVARQVIDLIADARDEQDITIAISGCDDYDVQSLETRLKNADSYLALPGAPDTGKRQVVLDASLAICNSASQETREKIISETINMPSDKLTAPIAPSPIGSPVADGASKGSDEPYNVTIDDDNSGEKPR